MASSPSRHVHLVVLVGCLSFCASTQQVAEAARQHQVGGTPGWTLPSRANINYTDWASAQKFAVGDTLYFNYSTEYHNVVQVSDSDYGKCNVATPMQAWADGQTRVKINTTGALFFTCSFPNHCSLGQKVAIKVDTSTSASSASSVTPSPSAASSPSAAALPLSGCIVLSTFSLMLVSAFLLH